ncbi:RNA recognition- RNP-1 [Apiospora rasikravindrae]|uniref:RNA recognition- RNP-1 n=1 Tax=Apiospora rasikravindrae TaxID=990691 RepID=A0ABR1S1B4_9PEZI
MNNLMNMRRPSRYGANLPAPQAMPTISDVSSDNSEGGAPLHEAQTFSQMRMGQLERNRVQRDAAAGTTAAGGPKPTNNHVAGHHTNGSPATVGPFPAEKQQPKTQAADNQSKLLQLLEKKEQSQKAAAEEQTPRPIKNGLTKSSSAGSYAGSSYSTISSEQSQSFANGSAFTRAHHQQGPGAETHQARKPRVCPMDDYYGLPTFESNKLLDHINGTNNSGEQDTDTSSQAYNQQGSPMPKYTKAASHAVNNGSQAVQAGVKGKGKPRHNTMSDREYQPLPPIPDLDAGAAQCRDIVVFQSVDDTTRAERSGMLNSIVPSSGLPSPAVLTHADNVPFTRTAADSLAAAQVQRGVVHIDNIPFGISRAEVIAFVGKNSRLLNDSEEPVHIIMDRVTSKTQDVYVEFATDKDAQAVVERHANNANNGRSARLGDRPVRVSLSSPAKLMEALFPVARGVNWYGYIPHILPPNADEPFYNFSVWASDEELSMVAKHAEEPRRSPFSKDARERPYECMISTVKKFPWFMTDHITLKQRYSIYYCCYKLLTTLQEAIQREECPVRLTPQLLKRFIDAMMLCPGFTVLQKDNFAQEVRMNGPDMCKFNMPRLAEGWRHQYALGPRPGIPMDVMEYYIAIIRDESTRYAGSHELSVKMELSSMQGYTSGYWGYFWHEVGYHTVENFDKLTLDEAAKMELSAVDRILRRALYHAENMQRPSGNGKGTQPSIQYHHGYPSDASRNGKMLAY